jgi:uncharacterized protein YndB with AHSA1/START domain
MREALVRAESNPVPVCKIDLRVGGKFLYCMRTPDGKDYWNTGVYCEIVERERIVSTDS